MPFYVTLLHVLLHVYIMLHIFGLTYKLSAPSGSFCLLMFVSCRYFFPNLQSSKTSGITKGERGATPLPGAQVARPHPCPHHQGAWEVGTPPGAPPSNYI